MNIYVFFASRLIYYFLCWTVISSFFHYLNFSEYLKPPNPEKNNDFFTPSVTVETHKLALEGNFLGLTLQRFREAFPGAFGGGVAVASLATWQYRKKQKDQEAIDRR